MTYNIFIFIVSSVLYRIELFILPQDQHNKSRSVITLHFHDLYSNFINFLSASFEEFGLRGKGFEVALGVIVLSGVVKILWVTYRKYAFPGIVLSFLYIIFSVFSLAGMFILLKYPTWDARVLLANGTFLCMYMTALVGKDYRFTENYKKAFFPVCALFIQIILAFCWGNVLKTQTSLDEYVTREILEDLSGISSSGGDIYVRFISSFPVSAQAQAIWEERRAISDSAMRAQHATWSALLGWMEVAQGVRNNEHILMGTITKGNQTEYVESKSFPVKEAIDMQNFCDFQKNIQHRYYNMYVNKDKVLIDFSKKCSQK